MECLEQQEFFPQSGADLLVHYLQQLQSEFIFTIPGGATEPILNALSRLKRPRTVLARHETGAAFMAQGYTQATGQLGLCLTTTGPGASNAVTGIHAAKEHHSPLLVITAQTPTYRFGQGAFQDSSSFGMDSLSMFESACLMNSVVTDVNQLEPFLVTSILTALGQPKGPVHLSLPSNILLQDVKQSNHYNLPKLIKNTVDWNSHMQLMLSDELVQSRHPLMIIGEDCQTSIMPIVRLAEKLSITMVSTPGAKGLVDPRHPLYAGVYGFAGHSNAELKLKKADKVLVLGSNLDEWEGGWNPILSDKPVFHISPNQQALYRSFNSRYRILSSVDKVVRSLEYQFSHLPHPRVQNLPMAGRNEKMALNENNVSPVVLMQYLSQQCPKGTRFYADTGNSSAWAIQHLNPCSYVCNWLHTSTHFGAMGWGIGAAIGAAIAGKNPVICITGDGSMLMNGSELSVAVEENANLILFILNDSSLGMVRHGQALSGAADMANRLPHTDFCQYARSLGANAIRIENDFALKTLDLATIMSQRGPHVIDLNINYRQIPPIGKRVEALHQ